MLLPLALAAITAIVLTVVIGPLLKTGGGAPERLDFDRAVYRDQLAELDRDLARGVIGEAEARTARLEIERRLLAADRVSSKKPRVEKPLPWVAWVLSFAVAGGAGALYFTLGSPGIPSLPFASRVAAETTTASNANDLEKSAAALEAKIEAKPGDVDSLILYGRTNAELGRWQQGADAFARALKLAPEHAEINAPYGEMLVLAANGVVTPAARAAFAAALVHNPKEGVARFYLALADAQAGRIPEAIAAWQKLAAEVPEGAPLRTELKRRIAAAAASAGIPEPPLAPAAASPPPAAAPGPDAAQMAAAAKMTPDERQQMIRGMVERLAAQLTAKPDDVAGWQRLGHAYVVLGERDKAVDAFEHAAKLDPKNVRIPLDEIDALLSDQAMEQTLSPQVVALLRRVEGLSPDEPEALWYLGLAAAQAKKPDEAQRYWQRLLAGMPPDAPERKTVSDALAALKSK
jgi:cytochrome c-type biogenesis protein CcmH